MNFDDYIDEIVWQLEFQGIVVCPEIHGLILAYWKDNVSPVAFVGMILGISPRCVGLLPSIVYH